MTTYHDRYARFGVIIGILVGVAIIAVVGLVSSCRTYPGWRGQERLEQEQSGLKPPLFLLFPAGVLTKTVVQLMSIVL